MASLGLLSELVASSAVGCLVVSASRRHRPPVGSGGVSGDGGGLGRRTRGGVVRTGPAEGPGLLQRRLRGVRGPGLHRGAQECCGWYMKNQGRECESADDVSCMIPQDAPEVGCGGATCPNLAPNGGVGTSEHVGGHQRGGPIGLMPEAVGAEGVLELQFRGSSALRPIHVPSMHGRWREDWCKRGKRQGLLCCSSECSSCGGSDCVGACCGGFLGRQGRICRGFDDVTCLIPSASLDVPWCSRGKREDLMCCSDACEVCTGSSCSGACCGGYAFRRGWLCEGRHDVACVIPRSTASWASAVLGAAKGWGPSLSEVQGWFCEAEGEACELPGGISVWSSALLAAASKPRPSLDTVELVLSLGGAGGCETFTSILLPSMRLFWPGARMVLLVDDTPEGRSIEEACGAFFGRVRRVLTREGGWNEAQQYKLSSDEFSTSEFVGFLDADTLFVTPVTSASVFDDAGRPRIRGRVGPAANSFWWEASDSTQKLLGFPEVARCMSYFPVVVRTEHLRGLREHIRSLHKEGLGRMVEVLAAQGKPWSEFNVLCSYLYEFHRREYSWLFQRSEPARANDPEEPLWISVSQHFGWTPGPSWHHWVPEWATPVSTTMAEERMAEGYCRVASTELVECEAFTSGSLQLDLFRFEDMQWARHPDARVAQEEHFREVRVSLWPFAHPAQEARALVLRASAARRAQASEPHIFSFPGRHPDSVEQVRGEEQPQPGAPADGADFTQCFVGPGLARGARLTSVAKLENLVIRLVHPDRPWEPRAESPCILSQDSQWDDVWNCELAQPLRISVGDCVGWSYTAGALAYWEDLASGRALLRAGPHGAPRAAWRTYALAVRWSEAPAG
mmetsp:Transcript_124801/g.398954  ORF Transcript_124801/g.398954 Transcript_124801/m.398954 type:complete len:850 (-) Transcript_124801:26-2575(-)